MPEPTGVALAGPPATALRAVSDPFVLMDRLDDELIRKELEGQQVEELIYVVKGPDGKDIVGLAKTGVDEACSMLARTKGEVIRELLCSHVMADVEGEPVALFNVTAARFAVRGDGTEAMLDQCFGVKAQPLYYEAAEPLTLDSPCPGKVTVVNGKRLTFRDVLAAPNVGRGTGREYLEWMARDFREEDVRAFVTRVLDGEDVTVQPGRQKNPFWYEQGMMKAARNARMRLLPTAMKAAVIALAKESGKAREVSAGGRGAAASAPSTQAPSGTGAPPAEPSKPTPAIVTLDTLVPFGKKWRDKPVRDAGRDYFEWLKTTMEAEGKTDGPTYRFAVAALSAFDEPSNLNADALWTEIDDLLLDESIPAETRKLWGTASDGLRGAELNADGLKTLADIRNKLVAGQRE